MSEFSGRVAVLTVAMLASFVAVHAADAPAGSGAFRDRANWTATDGVVSSSTTGIDNALVSRVTTADSLTSLEFKAPAGAHATLYLLGRYAVPMTGNGDWQKLTVRMRAPRFDAGYNKQSNAVALEITTGDKTQRNVIFEGASPGARWSAEDMRGPAFFVIDAGTFAVRNSRHDPANFDEVTPPAVSGGDQREIADRHRGARQGAVHLGGL